MSVSGKRIVFAGMGVLMLGVIAASALPTHLAFAANITPRSLTLEDGATDGGSMPSGVVKHLFTFTLPSTTSIQSIKFQYCTTADIDIGPNCTTPTGLDTTSAAVGTGAGIGSSFTIGDKATNGTVVMTAASAIPVDGTSSASIELTGVTNPDGTDCTTVNCTFFVHISTYVSADGSGTPIDEGTVAAAVNTQIKLTGTMPESLIFCTGSKISVNTNGIPDCTTATSGNITFSQLFSPNSTTYATSQMAASTNAEQGYVITVGGPTLKSGTTNKINAVGTTPIDSATTVGTSKFGMNLAADSAAPTYDPADPLNANSADVSPAPNGSNYMGKPTANFLTGGDASTALYAFDDQALNVIAKSDNGGPGAAGPTDSQIYTSTYMVNVSGSQPAGTYRTTLTYICTPTF